MQGFQATIELQLLKAEGNTAATLGLFLRYGGTAPCRMQSLPWVRIDFELCAQTAATPGVFSLVDSFSHTFGPTTGWGQPDFYELGPISSSHPLTPFLVGGELKLKLHIKKVDGVEVAR